MSLIWRLFNLIPTLPLGRPRPFWRRALKSPPLQKGEGDLGDGRPLP